MKKDRFYDASLFRLPDCKEGEKDERRRIDDAGHGETAFGDGRSLSSVKGSPLPLLLAAPAFPEDFPETAAEETWKGGQSMTIEILGLAKSYGGRKVIDGLDLSISDDARLVLTGPEGSGKTTLLRILAGLEKADSGQINLLGDYKHEEFTVGMVFQEDRLLSAFTAAENVAIVHKLFTENRAREALMTFLPEERCDIPVRELSAEEKRLTAIVRACMFPSNILLLDEPFRGLSEEMRQKALSYIREAADHKAIVFAQRTNEGLEGMREVGMEVSKTLSAAASINRCGLERRD